MDNIVVSPLQAPVPSSCIPPQSRKGRGRDEDFVRDLRNRHGELALFDHTHPFNNDPRFPFWAQYAVLWARKEEIQAVFEQYKRKWQLDRFVARRKITEADKARMLGLVGIIPEDATIPQAENIREYLTYKTE